MIKTAASAHAPSTNPATAHRNVERPRRDATTADSGASARSIAIDVAIRFIGDSLYPIRAKPDAMLSMLATVVIGLRNLPPI